MEGSIRLLAYGGTSYVERCRIGEWPPIPEGALSDTYSLVRDSLVYGVGYLDDERPFLILRERQNIENRGGYAFSILFDPGQEIWERFEWNGASLTQSLMGEPLGKKLLLRPEDCTQREIADGLNELQPHPGKQSSDDARALQALWVGVLLTEAEKHVVVSPQDAGFERRPSIETLASSLAGLQPCFRCGDGWLVGGSKEHGEAFGARLIFDEGAPDNPEISDLIHKGSEVIESWKAASTHQVFISAQPTFAEIVARRSAQPSFLWKWKTPLYDSPTEFLKGIITLARSLEDSKASSSGSFYSGKDVEAAIQEASRIAALSGRHLLDEFDTCLVLGQLFDLNLKSLAAKDVPRLQPQALIRELVRRKKRPTEADARMRLSGEIRLEVWRKLIEEETSDGIPMLLKDAVSDLLKESLRESTKSKLALSAISELAQAAIDRTSANCPNLLVWADSRDDPVLQPFIDERLRVEVLRRAKEGLGDWAIDYLAFGGDVGGTLLSQFTIGDNPAAALVTTLFATAQGHEKLSAEARQWLIALASSPLRAIVPLQKKIEVAKTLDDQWKTLAELWQLYCGQEPLLDTNRPSLTRAERGVLGGELREMIKTQRVGSAIPNLQGIIALLGGLTEEEIEMLAELRLPLTWKTGRSWLAGWDTLKRSDLHQRDMVRLVCLQTELPEDFSPNEFNDESLHTVMTTALTAGTDDSDAKSRHLTINLLTRKPVNSRISRITSAALEQALGDPARARVLARRFRQRSSATKALFKHLDANTQDGLIALFAESDEEQFQMEAYKLYMQLIDSWNPLSAYDRAVLRFLRRARAERIKNRIATWYHTFVEAGDIDENLDRLLDQPEPSKPDEVDEKTVKTSQGWIATSLKPLLPDRLNQLLFEVDEAGKSMSTDKASRKQTNASERKTEREKAGITHDSPEDGSDEPMN